MANWATGPRRHEQRRVAAGIAHGAVDDRVKGLKVGGDDYLTKPYAFSELLARIEVIGRRTASAGFWMKKGGSRPGTPPISAT